MLTYMRLMQFVASNRVMVATTDAGMYCLSANPVAGWKFQFNHEGKRYTAFWHGENSCTQMGCFTVEHETDDEEIIANEYWPHGAVVRLV